MLKTLDYRLKCWVGVSVTNNKPDLYSGIHKGQHAKFFGIMMKAGTMDYDDKNSLDRLYLELAAFREHTRLHASHEEEFIQQTLGPEDWKALKLKIGVD